MNTWIVSLVEWAVGLLLSHLDVVDSAKKGLATALTAINAALQAAVAGKTGALGSVEAEVAAAFDTATKAIVAALSA